jgi:hypothetical protein
LADHISDTGIFSDDRAAVELRAALKQFEQHAAGVDSALEVLIASCNGEMIARTEINMAMNQGVLEAGRQAQSAGLNVRKVWTLGPNPCPQCEDAAAEGDIDLDDDFGGDAGDAPPLHPNCECSVDLFVADEDQTDADDEVTREQALQRLLHSERGQALVASVAQHRKRNRKGFQMTRSETLRVMVKRHNGIAGLCQHIIKTGASDVSEAELTGMITAAAKAEHPDMDDTRAFAKLYTSPNGETLRRAIAIAKAAQLQIMPVQVGGDDVDVNNAEKAYTQLQHLADEQRRRSPELTRDQAFARVFSDPNNAALAVRAHKCPAPTTSYPFPR